MLFPVLVALLVAFLVLAFCKRFTIGTSVNPALPKLRTFNLAMLILTAGFGMAESTAGVTNTERSMSLRLVTLDETAQEDLRNRTVVEPMGLTAAGYRAKAISIMGRENDLAELREQIKYELRRGNITAERAATLSGLIDEINSAGHVAQANVSDKQAVGLNTAEALAGLKHSQTQLNETLADTVKLVEVLGSVRSPEFAGTLIAAKIQVVRLQADKAAVDSSLDEIRLSMKRPQAG